jgi:[acyl-carrier-protein] S-malonyltransferase
MMMTTSPYTLAFLFPGQGSQSVGMASCWQSEPTIGQPLLTLANQTITPNQSPTLSQLMAEGPEELLRQTHYTQPAILVHSLIAYGLFQQATKGAVKPVAMAGHSLGEYSALVATGVLTEAEALTIVAHRSQLMTKAPVGVMAAVLGLSIEAITSVLATPAPNPDALLVLANDNALGQVVLSGTEQGLSFYTPLLKEAGAKRVIPLPVGGAFHSPLMHTAAKQFEAVLNPIPFANATCPVISNVNAQASSHGEALKQQAIAQMPSPVQWVNTMNSLVTELGVTAVIEFGPGKVLTGLMKKTHPTVTVFNVFDEASLAETLTQLTPAPVGLPA